MKTSHCLLCMHMLSAHPAVGVLATATITDTTWPATCKARAYVTDSIWILTKPSLTPPCTLTVCGLQAVALGSRQRPSDSIVALQVLPAALAALVPSAGGAPAPAPALPCSWLPAAPPTPGPPAHVCIKNFHCKPLGSKCKTR